MKTPSDLIRQILSNPAVIELVVQEIHDSFVLGLPPAYLQYKQLADRLKKGDPVRRHYQYRVNAEIINQYYRYATTESAKLWLEDTTTIGHTDQTDQTASRSLALTVMSRGG